MSEIVAQSPPVKRARKTLKEAQKPQDVQLDDYADPFAAEVSAEPLLLPEQREEIVADDEDERYYSGTEDVVPEDQLVGFDPARKVYKFISPNGALQVRFDIQRIKKNGEPYLSPNGDKLYDTEYVKFKNGVSFVRDINLVKQMLRNKSYGGRGEKTTNNSDPLFWLDNYPAAEWRVIKERTQFITRNEREHEN